MAIRLVRLDAASTGYADEAWEYMQACKAVAGDELAGLGCLEDCTSLEQVRRHWLPQVVNEAEGETCLRDTCRPCNSWPWSLMGPWSG